MKKFFAVILTAALLMCMSAGFALAEGYVYITDTTNVRTGPGLGYNKIAMLREGSTVTYLQQRKYDSRGVAWYRVSVGTNNESGWVVSSYATLTNKVGSATYASGANAGEGKEQNYYGYWGVNTVTATGRVNVRSGPGIGYEIVNTMGEDDTAMYLGSNSYDDRGVMWYYISYEDTIGWVSSVYSELEHPEMLWFKWAKVVGGKCNVRIGPGLGYKSLGVAYKDEVLDYLGNVSVDERGVEWYYVSFDGQTGWISSTYSELF